MTLQQRDENVTTSANVVSLGFRARRCGLSSTQARLLGLVLAAFGPALFWTGGLALAGPMFGVSITATTLVVTLLAIAGFLAVVCGPLLLKS